ncbi:MAG: hypothetical protein ACD_63C00157G0002 [uncultured bacterium]|nr:MAG: hypothetical protein ACD_63C00157G0002 [uncultured bacterium]
MQLSFSRPKFKFTSRITKFIQWTVFLAFAIASAWCLWFYFDIDKKLKAKTEAPQTETSVNKNLLDKIKNTLNERSEKFSETLSVPRDPFR